ncbi:hypothetical protein M1O19_06495 [Dehalococcoidia bacterium]|nr:hypothetical protein [Dehalococcoidia bacterium]
MPGQVSNPPMTSRPHEIYSRFASRKVIFLLLALVGLAAMAILAVFVGGARLTMGEMMRAIHKPCHNLGTPNACQNPSAIRVDKGK